MLPLLRHVFHFCTAAQCRSQSNGPRPNLHSSISVPKLLRANPCAPPQCTCARGTTAGKAWARPRCPRPRARCVRPPLACSCPRPQRRASSPHCGRRGAGGGGAEEAEARQAAGSGGRALAAGRGRPEAPGEGLAARGPRTRADAAGARERGACRRWGRRGRGPEPGVPAPEPDGRPGGMRRWRGWRPAEPPRLHWAARR